MPEKEVSMNLTAMTQSSYRLTVDDGSIEAIRTAADWLIIPTLNGSGLPINKDSTWVLVLVGMGRSVCRNLHAISKYLDRDRLFVSDFTHECYQQDRSISRMTGAAAHFLYI